MLKNMTTQRYSYLMKIKVRITKNGRCTVEPLYCGHLGDLVKTIKAQLYFRKKLFRSFRLNALVFFRAKVK